MHAGDVARALELTMASDAMQRTRDLATSHAQKAADALGVTAMWSASDCH